MFLCLFSDENKENSDNVAEVNPPSSSKVPAPPQSEVMEEDEIHIPTAPAPQQPATASVSNQVYGSSLVHSPEGNR